ncbi:MAG TPA: ABC transporter permease [Rhodothermales bacterium]|nr:ABC transporter permease [Rhodothermales bacterium]
MLKNYLKIALRHLRRHKGYAFINVAGLAVGMAVCVLIVLFVRDELRYDRFHANADRIFRVVNERQGEQGTTMRAATPPAMGPTLVREFPEVQQAVRFFDMGTTLVRRGDKQIYERNVWTADSTLFDVFTLNLVSGDPGTALNQPASLILSESAAQTYFGADDPLGQTLDLSGGIEFTVTGVFEDWPDQSHIQADFIASFSTMRRFVDPARLENWIWQQFYTYILVPDADAAASLEAKLPAFLDRYADAETSQYSFTYESQLQPLTEVYLHSVGFAFDGSPRGSITYVYAFSGIALLILLIACFNFMNLATARSMQRAREVGMRKVIGAQRRQLVAQFLGESVLMALVALVVTVGVVLLVLPSFNAFIGKALGLDVASILSLLGGGLVVGLLAGSYPAFFLSAFRPLHVLKGGRGAEGMNLSAVRKGLVVAQFAISTLLIIGTAVVFQQLDYLHNKDLGFDKEQVVVLPLRGDMDDNLDALKSELLRHPGVTGATASWGVPGEWAAGDDVRLPGSDVAWPTNMIVADYDFIDTYRMHLIAGRGFSRDFPSDEREAFILNETAAQALGWTPEEAIGQELLWDEWSDERERRSGQVIGVVQDFHYGSLHQEIERLVLLMHPSSVGQLSVRIQPDGVQASMDHIASIWKTWAPSWPFEYEFLDEDIADEYAAEQTLSQLVSVFALLAIGIACLGLLGLAAFMAERRTKEVGVRKVLGASVPGIVLLLSKDFARLVLIAFVVAAPVAYIAMHRWLDSFVYRIDLGVGVFLAAGVFVLAIAWLTVSYQSIRAARVNPVESLRYE